MRTWARVADLVKPKSLHGGLVAHSAPGLPFLLEAGMEVAFVPPLLEGPRSAVVEEVQYLGADAFFVYFDAVTSIGEAEALAGSSVLVRRELLPDAVEELRAGMFAGYEVVDEVHGLLGHVVEVIDNKAQSLISVDGESGTVLVPYVDAIVIAVDEENRRIETRIPEGLLDC